MLSRFHLIPEHYWRTDGQTDRQICYINMLARDKNDKVSYLSVSTVRYFQLNVFSLYSFCAVL